MSSRTTTDKTDNAAIFFQHLRRWQKETQLLSVNSLDNPHFQTIVDMGVNAVPYILEELEKGPTQLVHALDLIFPDVVKYEGFVSLKGACDTWISILKQTQKHWKKQ